MVLFGLDIAHHQGGNPNLHQARAEGVEFVICKATEGSGFVDPRFDENIARAHKAGLLVGAYHYQRAGISAAAQVDNVRRTVPAGMPVIPDVEGNSGNVALTREIVDRLRAAGYPVPLLYLPRWYWLQIGKPKLAGLPPLWSSRYPDNAQGTIAEEYADVPAHYWDGFGGLGVALLQFSSSGRVAGYAPLDLNAFRGTRQEFAALLGGQSTPTDTDPMEDTNMELTEGEYQSRTAVVPKWAKEFTISRGFMGFQLHHVKWFGPSPETGTADVGTPQGELWIDPARPLVLKVPDGAVTAEVLYTLEGDQHGAVAAFR
ncbi:glycoside hydrolase family 25 protein [Amycolatopsis sp. YIM 10]|uniref:glycoside hydrolase family 25 protein n=1 Tax=Amycolatopsis sp. YIM 10 TaxID=2653857 RepID=UPI00129049FA|nr:glycoside hydrolase family 25 protein [Amycolatopsis sp. YIM 10]QFU87890.1 Lysozyme M1 precursor [Amycolatopsis sp. YIM 10]QFU94797.1 Lysozyme M1 precursor [Amycolatopsis sp. YIM 10]